MRIVLNMGSMGSSCNVSHKFTECVGSKSNSCIGETVN